MIHDKVPDQYNEGIIKEFLGHLSPENVKVFLISLDYHDAKYGVTEKEKHYSHSAFKAESMKGPLLEELREIFGKTDTAAFKEHFSLPPPNPHMPKSQLSKISSQPPNVPIIVSKERFGEYWALQDVHLRIPKTYCYALIAK